MRYKEIVEFIEKTTGNNIRQSDLVDATGVTRAAMSYRAKNNSIFPLEDIKKIADYFNLDLFNQINYKNNQNETENILVAYYHETGIYTNTLLNPVSKTISIPKTIINSYSTNKSYFVITATGDSMLPKIQDKDKLIIEQNKINPSEIIDNRIYFFKYDNRFIVKRLILNVNQLIIKSDNKEPIYELITLKNKELNKVEIIGKIVGLIREID